MSSILLLGGFRGCWTRISCRRRSTRYIMYLMPTVTRAGLLPLLLEFHVNFFQNRSEIVTRGFLTVLLNTNMTTPSVCKAPRAQGGPRKPRVTISNRFWTKLTWNSRRRGPARVNMGTIRYLVDLRWHDILVQNPRKPPSTKIDIFLFSNALECTCSPSQKRRMKRHEYWQENLPPSCVQYFS